MFMKVETQEFGMEVYDPGVALLGRRVWECLTGQDDV
jgi:hypothetical protein